VVWQLGDWARRWAFGDPEAQQLDGGWLLWRLRQFVREGALPERRVVVEFAFQDPDERGWLVLAPGEVSACRRHPGYEVDLWVTADLAEFHRIVAGTGSLGAAQRAGLVRLAGEPALVGGFADWFAWRDGTAPCPQSS
jgi:hypothetical protein